MNVLKVIEDLQLDKIDQEEYLKPAMRRGLFKKASDFSLKAALTSLPFALFAMPKIVQAHTSDAVTDTLNFALTLEYLEDEFYKKGLAASGLITNAREKGIFQQISKHETAHVALLEGVLGANKIAKPTFNFERVNATIFTDYQTFLAFAQSFEDGGVRAYKGQAGVLAGTDTLTTALQIHSVEARHASVVRRIRGNKGWIVQAQANGGDARIYGTGTTGYPDESNTVQGGVDLSSFAGTNGITLDHVTEAFDEPLDKATVVAIANDFFA